MILFHLSLHKNRTINLIQSELITIRKLKIKTQTLNQKPYKTQLPKKKKVTLKTKKENPQIRSKNKNPQRTTKHIKQIKRNLGEKSNRDRERRERRGELREQESRKNARGMRENSIVREWELEWPASELWGFINRESQLG